MGLKDPDVRAGGVFEALVQHVQEDQQEEDPNGGEKVPHVMGVKVVKEDAGLVEQPADRKKF